ncbi:hypothetical protein L6452_13960 [Arctium lappa]|uniref:Uncharacterized protein n=1 Tax=Arctium lappa TaxID=4217 RepID=A0ACB9CJR6_ARCLA|nr:hypothetical protein L6452_13960 [Arctium lappa]
MVLSIIYITLLSWDGTLLSFLTIPMLLCGTIKYGERTWVLMSADQKNLQDSFLGDRHTADQVNYTRFMEEFSLKEAEGYHVTASQMEIGSAPRDYTPSISFRDALHTADYFFETLKFKWLLMDLVLSFHERDMSRSFFQKQKYENAFQVIEYELSFAYDVLYTKAPIVYTRFGLICRLFTSFITISVLVTFFVSIGLRSRNHEFVDVVITYVLLIGAILLDSYAALASCSSDWAILWFSQHSSKIPSVSHSSDMSLQSAHKEKRWSHSMYQYGLLDFCLTQKSSAFYKISSSIPFGKRLRNLWVKYWLN